MLLNIGGHGLGDCLLSLQISYYLKLNNISHLNLISTRDEVFNPLKFLFDKDFNLTQIDEEIANDNNLLKNNNIIQDLINKYKNNDDTCEITYNIPDLLYCNKYAFDYNRFNLTPSIIKKTRIGLDFKSKKENIIYCGLCSTTQGYIYQNIPLLLIRLAEFLPDHKIYFPLIKKWDREINNLGNFNISFPSNVFIDDNPSFIDSLGWLKKSSYGIFTCNGPSHIAYQLGIPRLILDPQFNKIPWIARWKEDYDDCVPINIDINSIAQLVYTHINIPQTKMIDSKFILNLINQNQTNWENIFYFKY